MSYCPDCGHINADNAIICTACKHVLYRMCQNCKNEVTADSNFCPLCGTRLPIDVLPEKEEQPFADRLHAIMPGSLEVKINQAIASLIGERREATVLCWFIDIQSYKSGHFDGEARYILNDKIMRQLAEIIYEYEGTIDRYTGDYLVAFFGIPIAYENNSERALRAALDIKRKLLPLIESTNAHYGMHITTRTGIHTGNVIVSRTKQSSKMDYTVVGNIIDHAEILRDAADSDTILASFDTYQRTHPIIQFERIPLLTVRGSAGQVWAYRPDHIKASPGRVRGLTGDPEPMIGRDDALHWLQATWQEVIREKQCRTVFVSGEAGVGKTRLVTEFCSELQKTEAYVFLGSCMTYARVTSLHLIKGILRDMLSIDESKSAEEQHQQLKDALSHLGVQQADVLPYLTLVFDLEHNDPGSVVKLNNLDDAALQKLTHAAIRQVIEAISQIQPVTLIFEDLHWIDSASRSVLDYLLQTLDRSTVLLILISRSSERETVLQPLIEASGKLRQPMLDLHINPLSPDEITELIGHLLYKTTEEASALINQIVIRADGNPFFAEEIVRMLIDRGGIHLIRDTWYITDKAKELIQKTPGTLGDLILSRFDRLEEKYRDLLHIAAVCGLSFSPKLLIHLTTETHIEPILDQLIKNKFIVPEKVTDGLYYSFRHELIHEVIYNTLLLQDRQKLHGRIATVLEEKENLVADQQRVELLAHHFGASKNSDKAVPYLLIAADNASRRCDYETAVQHFRDALKNMPSQSTAHSDRILQAKIGLGRALKFIGDHKEASQILREALQAALYGSMKADLLARMVDGMRELAEIRHIEGASDEAIEYLDAGIIAIEKKGKQQNITLWRSLIDRMAWIHYRQGELEKAFALAGSATLGLNPEREDDPMTLASLYNTLGGILWEQGNLSEAVSYVQLSSRLYKKQRYIWGMANTDVNLGILYFAQGDWKNAAIHFTQADKYWIQMGDLHHRAVTLNNLGTLNQGIGQFDKAENNFIESLELFQRLGDIWGSARVYISLARFHLEQSEMKLANEYITQARELLKVVGAEDVELTWVYALIHAEQDLETALKTTGNALKLARESNLFDQQAECLLALGKLYVLAGDFQQAESLFRESVDLNQQVHSPYGLGLGMLELGKLYLLLAREQTQNMGDWHSRALDRLRLAVQQFSKLGAAHNLAIAQKIIIAIGTAPLRQADGSGDAPKSSAGFLSSTLIPEGEKRLATLVFITINTPVSEAEEDIFEAITQITQIIASTAERYHGQVVRQRNGMLLIFGAPQTYEDDPERAILAAYEILERVQKETTGVQSLFQLGIAVTQGYVIAGYIGPQNHSEFMVEGDPAIAVKELAANVPNAEVWVNDAVRNTTERIAVYRPVEGYDKIWRLEALNDHPRDSRGIPGLHARLIGRATSLNEMVALTKYLAQGLGGLIWIEGEPGIGKSRLMHEFIASIDAQGIDIWQGRCSPQSSEVAFSLFTDLLAQSFDVHARDPIPVIREKVTALYALCPRSLQITQPYLEVLLGAWPTGLLGERLSQLEPEQLRQQIFGSLRRYFKVLSGEKPLVIILDDLHWADTISAELLYFLLTLIATSPILFVCAQRRERADAPNDRLVRLRSLVPTQTCYLQLHRLTQMEREELLDELLPKNQISGSIRASIMRQCDGNPYFMEEYIRMLVEQGHLVQQQDHWVINQAMNTTDVPLPASLDLLIRARIDVLPHDLKQVVQIAAVLGTPFDVDILRAVCDYADIEAKLERLASRLLVRQTPDGHQWTFH
ncbi:MAG: tetratricopeptide repeat protein, partial [Anaerolineales bacterium]